eukprot:bmy_13448T0
MKLTRQTVQECSQLTVQGGGTEKFLPFSRLSRSNCKHFFFF